MRREALALIALVALAAGCARVALPPGRERLADDKPPRLKKVKPVDANHVDVYFSEGMEPSTLRELENYAIVDEAGRPLAVEAAVIVRPDLVTLVTEGQEVGAEYRLLARNVADASGGNPIEGDNRAEFKGSPEVDDKAPAVVATYPPDGAEQVGLFPEVQIEFTDVLAAEPGPAEVVVLYDDLGAAVPVDGKYEGARLRFRPSRRLDYATTYVCVVADRCTDLAGNVLYRENRFSFTTLEDREEVIVTGVVRLPEEGLSPAQVELGVSLSPRPGAEGARLVAWGRVDEEGKFVLAGIPPNSEAQATYYLVARLDADGEEGYEFVGGYGFAGGKAAALPNFLGGERLENVEVVLTRADVVGPVVEAATISPDPTAGQKGCYLRATFADADGSAVGGAEVFFDDAWSDGTGLELLAVGAAWNTSPRATAERYLLDLGRWGVKDRGTHVAYFHARDASGNWGEFYEVGFEVTAAPRPAREIEGVVWFEKLPAEEALVAATAPGEEGRPLALALTDKKGRYALEDLAPGAYEVVARLDEDGDGRWRRGEPAGVASAPVDVRAASARAVDLTLTYGPSLSAANARLHNYAAGPGRERRAVLTISAAARDRDLDLAAVLATLPDGEEIELADDGEPPDAAAGDGIFTWRREYRGEEVASCAGGEVALVARDGRGNRAAATAAEAPGLRVSKLEPPPGLGLAAGAEALEVTWEAVEGAEGGYVVFLVPSDRLERFTAPGTGEVFSNFRHPAYGTSLTIPYAAIEDWWAYPAGSRFVVFLVASAGDADSYEGSDKAFVTSGWSKPAPR
jgi:hypothetical protein